VLAAALVGGTVGYAAVPGSPASAASTGMTLGHVPMASAPTSASIVIGKDAADHGYESKVVTISQGGSLSVVNLDSIDHTVTAVARSADGQPLFDVDVAPGATASVPAASKLAAGTYDFYCKYHPRYMRAKLVVEGGDGGGVHPVAQTFDQPLKTPRVLTGSHLTIPVEKHSVRMLPHGPKTPMWTYGGNYPGPTIRRPAGHDTKVTFVDHLPKSVGGITVHLHGDHHTSANDGQPTKHLIHHGHRRTYDYPLTDAGKPERAAFDYYHDHRMNETGRNNWNGLQGMMIVDDRRTPNLKLPAGRHDVPLLVSDRSFTKTNHLTEPFPSGSAAMSMAMTGPKAPPGDATVGNHVLVDGRYAPYLRVSAHRYRFRLLNASNFASYDFALSDGRPFVQVGTGSGLLPKPVVRQDILLGPAQRADVVVDFHGALHRRIVLQSVPRTDSSPKGIGTPSVSIMQFRVTRKVKDHTRLPSTLEKPPALKAPRHVSAVWTFGLHSNQKTGSYWTVNGKPFDPKRVDLTVPLGSTQTWKLRNLSPITHYIHIHEEQWHTVSRNGKKPPPWERGLEDTWRLDPGDSVKVAARFTDYTGVFMIHCHMLDHEDHGMMAQFAVVKRHAGHASALPAGFSNDDSAVPTATSHSRSMSMSMPMSMPMGTFSSDAATAAARGPSPWSRLATRSGRALAVELLLLTVLVALRRIGPGRRRDAV
jgi:FtsP/CotA-like multicopper oxidase with cupredoxin domain